MKYFFTLIFFCVFTQLGIAQSACDNFERAKSVQGSADLKHHGTLKQIVLYWSKRCACESGAITGGTWDYTVEVGNRVYDNYKSGNLTKDYNGPSFPIPDRKLAVNDCNNDNNFNITPDISDCKPDTFDKTKDPQQYGNAYMLARCECEKGVPNQERAQQLEATMKINFQNAQTYYGNTLGMPQPMKWTDCPIIQFGGIGKTVNYDNGRLVNDDYLNLLNTLAEETKSLHFKNMVDEMNTNRDDFAQGRSIAMQFGTISQQDMDTYNMFENLSQGIAIGKFIFNELSNALTPEQEAAREYIQGLYTELNAIYKEVSYVPNFSTYNDQVIDFITKKERLIDQYEQATSVKRLLYLEYWYQNKPYMTIDQLQNKAAELEALKASRGNQHLIEIINQKGKSFEQKEFKSITNKEYGFKATYTRLKMNEANYYEAKGDKSKAKEIRSTIDYDVHNFDAFKLLDESFASKDYFGSIAYYEQVKEVLRINENGGNFFLFYKNIPNITFKQDGVWRHEATYLLALGVLANIRTDNLTQAEEELAFLKQFNENHKAFNASYATLSARKKADKFTDVEYQTSYGQCLAIEKAVASILLAKQGEAEQSSAKIKEAKVLLDENPLLNKSYNAWIELLKFESEILSDNYTEARRTAINLNRMTYTANQDWVKLFSVEDFKYMMAFMKFKQKQYQSCINQIEILEAGFPKSLRLKMLKLDAYKALNNAEKANEIELILNQTNN
jgi:hypothetical protein